MRSPRPWLALSMLLAPACVESVGVSSPRSRLVASAVAIPSPTATLRAAPPPEPKRDPESDAAPAAFLPGPTCPAISVEPAPTVVVHRTLDEAARRLLVRSPDADTHLSRLAELREMLKDRGNSLFVDSFRGYFPESVSSRHGLAAVFVEPAHIVTIPALGTNISAMMACPAIAIEGREIAVLDVPEAGLHWGHFRVVRADVPEPPTLLVPLGPPRSSDPECSRITRYRIEDHFVDLKAAEHRFTLVQVFESRIGDTAVALPGAPFDAFRLGPAGIEMGECAWGLD